MNKTRVRVEPRISLNKLSEYMTASPKRRWRIICDQKRPPVFQAARYSLAQTTICDYLKGGAKDNRVLLDAITRLHACEPSTEWDRQRVALCIQALECFLEFPQLPVHQGMTVLYGTPTPPTLLVGGLQVSVRPDILVSSHRAGANGHSGAIKLYFGKTLPLDEVSGKYAATLLFQYLEENPLYGQQPLSSQCAVLDIFAKRTYTAPQSHRRIWGELTAACEEIARVLATA